MENIKVIVWGIGTMGTLMAKILAGKEGVELVGALTQHPIKSGGPSVKLRESADTKKSTYPGIPKKYFQWMQMSFFSLFLPL